MSKKFYAVNRGTGERWKPRKREGLKEYLVMYDSGYLAAVSCEDWVGCSVSPLNTEVWQKVVK